MFKAYTSATGYELYESDGTGPGTSMVKEIYPSTGGSNISTIKSFGNSIYFSARNDTDGYELWKSDGTESGTLMLKDIRPGGSSDSSTPNNFTVLNERLFFLASNDASGRKLYVSDGTSDGTNVFIDFADNNKYIYRSLLKAKDYIYYFLDKNNELELWRTNGTLPGTFRIDMGENLVVTSTNQIHVNPDQNWLYFVANDNINGAALWRTDGSNSPAEMLYSFENEWFYHDGDDFLPRATLMGQERFFFSGFESGPDAFKVWAY